MMLTLGVEAGVRGWGSACMAREVRFRDRVTRKAVSLALARGEAVILKGCPGSRGGRGCRGTTVRKIVHPPKMANMFTRVPSVVDRLSAVVSGAGMAAVGMGVAAEVWDRMSQLRPGVEAVAEAIGGRVLTGNRNWGGDPGTNDQGGEDMNNDPMHELREAIHKDIVAIGEPLTADITPGTDGYRRQERRYNHLAGRLARAAEPLARRPARRIAQDGRRARGEGGVQVAAGRPRGRSGRRPAGVRSRRADGRRPDRAWIPRDQDRRVNGTGLTP